MNETARGRIFPRSYGAGRYLSITLGSVLLAFVLLHATAAQETSADVIRPGELIAPTATSHTEQGLLVAVEDATGRLAARLGELAGSGREVADSFAMFWRWLTRDGSDPWAPARALVVALVMILVGGLAQAAAARALTKPARRWARFPRSRVNAAVFVIRGFAFLAAAGVAHALIPEVSRPSRLTSLVLPVIVAGTQEKTMELGRRTIMAAAALGLALSSAMPLSAVAQMAPSITTPDKVESSIGTLEYKDGAPSKETVAKVYDYLDLMHGVEAFVNAYQGASVAAIFKGFEDAGVPDNTALIWSELMDAKSLFLTANADTVYFWVNLNVTKGPLVVETPPLSLGVIDDIWFRWVTDFGLPGPDRGEGGRYLLVPPGYKGELPESGYSVHKLRTTRATALGRSFLENNDPKPRSR